jgi:glycerol-3-phosphate dehydrogenase
VLGRKTRFSFLDAQTALEAMPVVIDLMAEELTWNETREDVEWKQIREHLTSMGLLGRS